MALPDWSALKGALIVSVQAPEGSPLRQPLAIAAMAEACLANGAAGVRLESPEHIAAVRRRCPQALIVGLWKRSWPDSSVYITPRWQEITAVWGAGADVVALDATDRPRPEGQSLDELVRRAREELGVPLMADVDGLAAGQRAADLGCAWVGTTLFGYTEATRERTPPSLELVRLLRDALPSSVPVVCEGGIASPEQAMEALRHGADLVVVGTAITGVDALVERYVKTLREDRKSFCKL
ncbi:MAG: N-acetylmannosamine-6-phosphate 2-epimerase [Cyanobacteriota bacterium]|nr:N-acetylmannosamine-6-phosphate 2-epimerase [Cyanobacteriota bacterium]